MGTRGLPLIVGLALTALDRSASVQPSPAAGLRSYLASAVTLTEAEFSNLDRGRPVSKVLASRNTSEIYLLGLIYIAASPAAYVERVMDPARLATLPGYRGVARIDESSTASDLSGFTLEPDDVDDLRDCHSGDCAVQLPVRLMPAMRAGARNSDRAAAARLLNAQLQTMALDLVRDYRGRGNDALPVYEDESREASARDRFRALVAHLESVSLLPHPIARALVDYRGGAVPGEARSAFYWEKVIFGLKPTLRIVHATAFAPEPDGGLACAVGIKQLYASHYLRAAIDFSACVPAPERNGRRGFYLVSVTGSQQEGVTGFTGSIVRRIATGRARSGLDGALVRLKNALEAA